MLRYAHDKLIERIALLDNVPECPAEYTTWVKADGHLDLLRDNAKEDELIIYGSGDFTFIHAIIANEQELAVLDQGTLLSWNGHPRFGRAGYVWGGEGNEVWIEQDGFDFGSKTLKDANQMVFARTFEGMKGKERSYFEILQEYAHLTEIHWRPELHAYCRFDENGDFDPIVSITPKGDGGDVTLVSFKREPLELYLAATNSVLVRMFEFQLFRGGNFPALPDGPENVINVNDDFFYRQKVNPGKGAYTRGVQIIRPSRPKE